MFFQRLLIDRVNRATKTLDGAAGKSINVAKVLQVLGAHPRAVGFLGGDRGQQLRATLEALALEMEFVVVSTPTRQCVTVIDESDGTITELVEESGPVEPEAYDRLTAIVSERIPQSAAVVMSGTITQGGPSDFYLRCTHLSREAGAMAVIDAAGPLLLTALPAGPFLVKPNRPELENTLGQPLRDEEALVQAMHELHARGAQRVVITSGREAALAFDGEQLWRVTPPQIAALNPIGSGDAFTAGLVWRLTQGDALGEACCWGSAAGAANALTAMAGELRKEDVEALRAEVRVERI